MPGNGGGFAGIEAVMYNVRLARTADDVDAVLRLRFDVFNRELDEGLESSWLTGRDEDRFDAVCDHLLVEDGQGAVAGTYRMQTAEMAARSGLGFYSANEFDLTPHARMLRKSVEVGRACVAREHRNRRVLFMLWKGLADYLVAHRKRYLFGCCSLATTDPEAGKRALENATELPPLFQMYLRHGAKVLDGPVIDPEFRTTDFLVLLDVHDMDDRSWRLFFAEPRD
jgi:putative hemolysin